MTADPLTGRFEDALVTPPGSVVSLIFYVSEAVMTLPPPHPASIRFRSVTVDEGLNLLHVRRGSRNELFPRSVEVISDSRVSCYLDELLFTDEYLEVEVRNDSGISTRVGGYLTTWGVTPSTPAGGGKRT